MLIDILATFSAGFGGAGVALALSWIARRLGVPTPRWIVPALAGAGMIAYSIWSEYSWFGRHSAGLPEGVRVVAIPEGAPWRPWSYIVPVTTRFVALDTRAAVPLPEQPGQVAMPALFVQRWTPTRTITLVFDCAGQRPAEFVDGNAPGEGGTLTGGDWPELGPRDALVQAACDGG